MPLTLLADRQYTAPSAANSVSITPNAVAWVNSAYVTLLDPTPAALVLTGVTAQASLGSTTADVEVDIATGAAAAEVVIATVRLFARIISAGQWGPTDCCVLPIPVDNIAAGVRVAARLRKNNTSVVAWGVAITYLQKPLTGPILTTAQPPKTVPPAAIGVTLTASATPWASGPWGQLRAASGSALVITGLVLGSPSAAEYELDLGTGGVGTETVITTVHLVTTTTGCPGVLMLPTPLDAVAAGTRLAARLRSVTASATLIVSVMVLEQPL